MTSKFSVARIPTYFPHFFFIKRLIFVALFQTKQKKKSQNFLKRLQKVCYLCDVICPRLIRTHVTSAFRKLRVSGVFPTPLPNQPERTNNGFILGSFLLDFYAILTRIYAPKRDSNHSQGFVLRKSVGICQDSGEFKAEFLD